VARTKNKAGLPSESPIVAKLTQDEAILSFKGHIMGWHKQSLLLACSATVCLIVGTHGGKASVDQATMIDRLKTEVSGTGLSDSQAAKYIGLAKALANYLLHKFKVGGPVTAILGALTADEAVNEVVLFLGSQSVHTLEDMTVMFDKYKRTPPKPSKAEAGPTLVKNAPSVSPDKVEEAPEPRELEFETNGKGTYAIRDMIAESAEAIILKAVKSGHSATELCDAAIHLLDSDELEHVRVTLAKHAAQIARTPAARPAKRMVAGH
jgi:hypothetical protein